MVKKISVFIMILGLFFVGIPQAIAYPFEQTDNVFYSYNKVLSSSQTSGNLIAFTDNEYFALATFVHVQRFVTEPVNNVGGKTVILPANSTYQIKGELGQPYPGVDYIISFTRTDIVDSSYNFSIMIPDIGYNSLIFRQFISSEYSTGYDEGFKDASKAGYDNAYYEGYNDAYDSAWDSGWEDGYWYGLNETDATGFVGLLGAVFGGLGALLAIELLPGIYIGAIIAVPLVFGIIFFILGKRKGD